MAKFGLGTWSHSVYDFGDKDQIKRHADRLAKGGFKLLIPCVKNPPGFADFFTDVADVNQRYSSWDPLRVLIDACQERDIKVHLWFCIFPEGEKGKLLREHPQYQARFESRFPWACACRPPVKDYLLALYKDVAERYKPDGLHLDYIRTGGQCVCEYCKWAMKGQGVEIQAIRYGSQEFQKWMEWRAENITDFVRRARAITKKLKMELSAAVFSNYPDCIEQQGQDWVSWAEEKLVDYMFPMTYTNSLRMLEMKTRAHVAQMPSKVPLWVGLGKNAGSSALSTKDLTAQVKMSLECGAKGVVLFSYPAVTDEDIKAIKKIRG